MKIGLMIYGSLEQISGGYLYDRKMVEQLRRMGADVGVVSLSSGNYARHLTENIFSARHRALLQQTRPDILLQDELCHPSLFYLNQTLRPRLDCPVISIVHHLRSSETRPAWQNRFYRQVEKHYLAAIDGFIFNSETTRGVVRDLLGRDCPAVVAWPGGDHAASDMGFDRIRERAFHPGPLRLLFVGNVIPRKGLRELIGALSRLPSRHWRLTIAGDNAADAGYAKQVRELIAGEGLAGEVTWLGPVDDETLAGLLATHQCLAVPSFYEGFGIVYLEAMAFGLPVIAAASGAVPEVLDDGREGFLVPPGDQAALADRIDRLIRDRNLLAALSLGAKKRHQQHPSWADGAERIYDFLQGIIRMKKADWELSARQYR